MRLINAKPRYKYKDLESTERSSPNSVQGSRRESPLLGWNSDLKDTQVLILEYVHVTLCGKRDFAGMIKFRVLE